MANTPMYDPKSSEARSSWLAGLTEACAKLSSSLNLKTASIVGLQLNELFISEDDRYRIYQAELGHKLWVSDPAPVIMQNGLVITPENNYFTIDYLGGSIAFEQGHTLDENDTITANVTYITGASSEIESLNTAIQAAQQSAGAFRGYYQTYDNLVADISDPQIGNFAIVGGDDNSVYIWNITSKKWENTFKETDLSNYYTSEEVDDELDKKEDAIDSFGSTSDSDNYYYGGRKQWVNVFEKVLGTTLAGLVTTATESVSDSDNIIGAIGKLQAQIDGANKSISDNYDELTSSIDGLNAEIESIESTIAKLEASIKDKQPVKTTFTVRSDEWSDHSVTVNDDKILADTKYVYVLGLSGDSMGVYEGGSIWADDITSDGSITLRTKPDADIAVDLTFELLRFETSEENTHPYGAKVISKILGGGGSTEGFRPTSIKILTPPTTVQYYVGETFVPDGMTVEIIYENGAKLETTGYRWQPSGPLEYGTENVTVIFSENGGTVSAEQSITVIREEVAVPYQEAHLTYNKNVQQANFTNYDHSKMSVISGDIFGENADTYTTTFRLSSIRYEWSDTHTTEDRDVSWVIDRFTIQNVPYADDLVYNEKEQSPVWKDYDPEQLEIGGQTEGTEPETYTATFTPVQPNYQWEDGDISAKEVQWKIVPPFTVTFHVFAPEGATITCTGPNYSNVITSTGEDDLVVHEVGTYFFTRDKNHKTDARSVRITKEDDGIFVEDGSVVPVVLSYRYGYRKKKAEGDPAVRIEYLYDAVDMTPAHMDFSTGTFDYGDWGDVFFVKKNRPVMLRYDRTVDYELDHDDQTKKLGGGDSDISNTNYDGNAMSEFPLCWFYRYENNEYEYEIVCEHQWDDLYQAYAHTRADGSIADCFYWSMFGGSEDGGKARSLADKAAYTGWTLTKEVDACKANGDGWYIHTWSQREYIRTLLVLMGKSTNTQAVFGMGNAHVGNSASVLRTGTLKNNGQFYGVSADNKQVKVFYIERFWGDVHDRTAGVISVDKEIYYKMTPEGMGYHSDNDVDGYTRSGIACGSATGYISKTKCGQFGCLPIEFSGSDSTYECDLCSTSTKDFMFPYAGGGVNDQSGKCGAYMLDMTNGASFGYWSRGFGLSAEMPLPKEEE